MPNSGFAGFWSSGLAFDDFGEVGDGEDDAAAVEVERHLPAVGTGSQGALGDRGQPSCAQHLSRDGRGENLRQCRPV